MQLTQTHLPIYRFPHGTTDVHYVAWDRKNICIKIRLPHAEIDFEHNLVNAQQPLLNQRIETIARLIEKINKHSSIPVPDFHVYLLQIPGFGEVDAANSIKLDIWSPDYMSIAAHEAAHVMFTGREPIDWRFIFYFSQNQLNCNIVKDSDYLHPNSEEIRNRFPSESNHPIVQSSSREDSGHPWENPTELFASSLNAYVLHADEFLARIADPSASPDRKLTGKLIYLYLRDKIFKGKSFAKTDPFTNTDYWQTLKELSVDAMIAALSGIKKPLNSFMSICKSNTQFTGEQINKALKILAECRQRGITDFGKVYEEYHQSGFFFSESDLMKEYYSCHGTQLNQYYWLGAQSIPGVAWDQFQTFGFWGLDV